jgi:hypothetical protein
MQVVKPLLACHCLHLYERSLGKPVMLSLSGFLGQGTSGQTGEKDLRRRYNEGSVARSMVFKWSNELCRNFELSKVVGNLQACPIKPRSMPGG